MVRHPHSLALAAALSLTTASALWYRSLSLEPARTPSRLAAQPIFSLATAEASGPTPAAVTLAPEPRTAGAAADPISPSLPRHAQMSRRGEEFTSRGGALPPLRAREEASPERREDAAEAEREAARQVRRARLAEAAVTVQTPIAYQPAPADGALSPEEQAQRKILGEQFAQALGEQQLDPADPQYQKNWEELQPMVDREYQVLFGDAAFAAAQQAATRP